MMEIKFDTEINNEVVVSGGRRGLHIQNDGTKITLTVQEAKKLVDSIKVVIKD